MKQRGTKAKDLMVSLVEVGDIEIQMKLLRARGVRPPRRSVVLHTLEPEHKARGGVKGREVVVDRPPRIGLVDPAAQERLIEPREFQNIRAVQNHALQPADHRKSFP